MFDAEKLLYMKHIIYFAMPDTDVLQHSEGSHHVQSKKKYKVLKTNKI